ncbi:MAG: hypothetical protein QT04_C0047G0031 [archaeon GW2011_AR11]|nr:MAG: hypothetical protein QT04_C0047G0031 [archaeon GW2011_AR11]
MSRGAALAFLKGCREGMHLFGQNIALIINTILLTAVYVLGVGMTSLIAKMAGRHFLETRMKKGEKESYWKDLNLGKKAVDEHYRQF